MERATKGSTRITSSGLTFSHARKGGPQTSDPSELRGLAGEEEMPRGLCAVVAFAMGVSVPLGTAMASTAYAFVAEAAPDAYTSSPAPSISLSPGSGAIASTVTVTGSGFGHGGVQLSWDTDVSGMPSAQANGNGSFRVTFSVPSGSSAGDHAVGVTGTGARNSGMAATATFSVVGPLPTPTAGVTPTASATATVKPTVTPTATASPPSAGFVTRSGTSLLLGGAPYRFTGMNIYNANSRDNCWYSLGYNDNALGVTLAMIGPGQEAFRAWFYQGLATTNGVRDWTAFDHTIAVAKASGVRIVAQLSGEGGDCGDYPADQKKYEWWYASGYKQPEASGLSFRDWAREVATRYANEPTILMWQMVGEAEDPIDGTGKCSATAASTLKSFADDIAAVLKSADPRHLVNLSTIGSGQCGASGADYQYVHSGPNIDLCEYHDYGSEASAMPGDQWNGLAVRISQCQALNKPLFIGEAGILRTTGLTQRAALLDQKMSAEFAAGIVGYLIWDWNDGGGWHPLDDFNVGPSDPALALLVKY